MAAYAQLGLYEERIRQLAVSDQAPLEVQYHAYNALRHISEDFIAKDQVAKVRTDIQNALLRKLQSNKHRNAVRIWAFEALYTPFIFNPEEDDPTLSDALEKALESIVNEPLNQVMNLFFFGKKTKKKTHYFFFQGQWLYLVCFEIFIARSSLSITWSCCSSSNWFG